MNESEWEVVDQVQDLYKLRGELHDVLWFDSYNGDVIYYMLNNNKDVLSIGEALELGLDKSKKAMWPENLRTHNHELDRTFLRLIKR